MKEPTIEEIMKLVDFERDDLGKLYVKNVNHNIEGSVRGYVGDVFGDVLGDVWGNVIHSVRCNVYGTINGRKWQFEETPKERIVRLIREGKGEEAIKVLEESE